MTLSSWFAGIAVFVGLGLTFAATPSTAFSADPPLRKATREQLDALFGASFDPKLPRAWLSAALNAADSYLAESVKFQVYQECVALLLRWKDFAAAKLTAERITDAQRRKTLMDDIALAQDYPAGEKGTPETSLFVPTFPLPEEWSQVHSLLSAGDLEGAKKRAASTKNDRTRADLLASVARRQAESGDFAGAKKTASEIDYHVHYERNVLTDEAVRRHTNGPYRKEVTDCNADQEKLELYLFFASLQRERFADVAAAQKTLREARQIAVSFRGAYIRTAFDFRYTVSGEPARYDSLLSIARAQIDAQDRPAALETLKLAQKSNVNYDLVQLVARAGNLSEAKRLAAATKHADTGKRALVEIADVELGQSHPDDAAQTLLPVPDGPPLTFDGSTEGDSRRVYQYETRHGRDRVRESIVKDYLDRWELAKAIQVAAAMPNDVEKVRAYVAVAVWQTQHDQKTESRKCLETAREAAISTPEPELKVDAYRAIGLAGRDLGDSTSAKAWLKAADDIAELITVSYRQKRAYGDITIDQLAIGEIKDAQESARKACLADGHAPGKRIESAYSIVCQVIDSQMAAGDLAGAIATASFPESNYPTSAPVGGYTAIIRYQVDHGDIQGAKATAGKMPTGPPSRSLLGEARLAFAGIARAQANSSDITSLKDWVETLTDPLQITAACLGAAEGRGVAQGLDSNPSRHFYR